MKKTCSKCKLEKEEIDFPFRNKSKNQLHDNCRECWKTTRKKSYENHKKYYKDKNIRIRTNNTEWFIQYKKTLKCNNCDENHPACLEFHHVDSQNKKTEVGKLITTYSIETIKEEIEKCIVLCNNCHRKLHYEEIYGPIV